MRYCRFPFASNRPVPDSGSVQWIALIGFRLRPVDSTPAPDNSKRMEIDSIRTRARAQCLAEGLHAGMGWGGGGRMRYQDKGLSVWLRDCRYGVGVRGGGQNEISGQGAECLAEGLQVWGGGGEGVVVHGAVFL